MENNMEAPKTPDTELVDSITDEPQDVLAGQEEQADSPRDAINLQPLSNASPIAQEASENAGNETDAAFECSSEAEDAAAGEAPVPEPPVQDGEQSFDEIRRSLQDVVHTMQSLVERMGAIETAFPILRKDVLSLAKSVSGLYTTTTDRMHAKIEKYDRGLEQTIAKPYLLSIAKLGDALRRSIAIAEANPADALAQLLSLRDDIRVPLWNAGLRVIDVEPGVTPFNPRLHDGIDIVATGDIALDGIVESVVETGYQFAPETDDVSVRPRVFRAALVRVFKFDKALEPVDSTADEQSPSVN